ncbi:MAG: putative RNA-binding protein with PIN domain [Kiritimatiellia bacterium]|jgi:predicted RNA-binding protein with PIN domain
MSIGVKLKTMFSGGAGSCDPTQQLVIVDGATLYDGRRNGAKLSPRDQIDILQALSNICNREKFVIQAVFEGEPLRKVDHGEFFDEVKVLYAQEEVTTTDLVLELMTATTLKKVIVVTANVALETQAAAKGATTLRSATFRKGFEEFNTGSSGGSGRRSGNNPQRRKGGRGGGGGGDEEKSGGAKRNRSGGNRNRGGNRNDGNRADGNRADGNRADGNAVAEPKDVDGNREGGNEHPRPNTSGGNRRGGNRRPRADKPRHTSNEPDVSDLIDLIE